MLDPASCCQRDSAGSCCVSRDSRCIAGGEKCRKIIRSARSRLPPTLEAIRLAGLELSDLGEEMTQGVQSASAVVQQVDRSLIEVKKQAQTAQTSTRSVWVGVKAAWRTWRDSGGDGRDRRQLSAQDAIARQDNSDLDDDLEA